MKNKSIEKFNALPVAEKRIAIAKDVIAQVKAKKYKATHGELCRIPSLDKDVKSLKRKTDLRSLLPKAKVCHVCAKGSVMISLISKSNDFAVHPSNNGVYIQNEEVLDRVKKIFTRQQIDLIEIAFEGRPFYWSDGELSPASVRNAANFSDKYERGAPLLIAIMENIIKNKGTFKP